jgi:succinyl-CoA synthetase beta subunit
MRLIEADAKQLLQDAGLPVPPGRFVLEPGERWAHGTETGANKVAVKAQLLAGGRGKTGLVKLVASAAAEAAINDVRDAMCKVGLAPLVMIEDQVDIEREFFVAWAIDDLRGATKLMFSAHGGIDVEAHAGHLVERSYGPLAEPRLSEISAFLSDVGIEGRALGATARFALDLYHFMVRHDALVVEINPLAITSDGRAIAVDAKVTLDENASRRHLDWDRLPSLRLQLDSSDPIERDAHALGITFVRLDGKVALLTGGAGLGMTLVDLLADAGHGAANFVDMTGGSGAGAFEDLARLVFRRAEEPGVEAILMFLTMSATSLKSAVGSILRMLAASPPRCPLVVGIVAGGSAEREMTVPEAQAAFHAAGYECVTDLDAAVQAVSKSISG